MTSRTAILVVLAMAFILATALGGPGADTGSDPANTTEYPATVAFHDENGTQLGVVQARVADSPDERYEGLSNTDPLPPNHGMLFVFDEAAKRTFVMRQMNYPIDMVFIGADGTVTTIHHAETEANDDPGEDLTPYPGRAKWVLEVPYQWTSEHGVEVGDEVSITYT